GRAWRSRQDHVSLDRVHLDALLAKPGHTLSELVVGGFELEYHPSVVRADVGAPDIGNDAEVRDETVDDGLLHQLGGEGQPHPRAGHGICPRRPAAPAHRPPAIAGTMETWSPALSVVLSPWRKRMSSSLTLTLMKRRISPLSSTRRSLRPGTCFSRLSIRPATVSAWPSTSAWPFVSERSGVGMRTSTGMGSLLRAGSAGGL